MRVGHRVEVARLAREVEDDVLPTNEVAQAVLVADVRDVHAHAILDAGDVVQVAAVLGTSESTSVTSAPAATSVRARFEPMKPSPPVIRIAGLQTARRARDRHQPRLEDAGELDHSLVVAVLAQRPLLPRRGDRGRSSSLSR